MVWPLSSKHRTLSLILDPTMQNNPDFRLQIQVFLLFLDIKKKLCVQVFADVCVPLVSLLPMKARSGHHEMP